MAVHDRRRILCVEPDKDFCELLTVTLPDFDFVNSSTQHDAIRHAREGGFSLIILENSLPDGSGEEACRQIRVFDRRTPILFMSGSRAFSDTLARAAGAQGCIKKTSPRLLDELIFLTTELALP